MADFSHLPVRTQVHRDDAAMGLPQLSRRQGASAIRASISSMNAEATGLIEEDDRVVGVKARRADGPLDDRRRSRRRRRRTRLGPAQGARASSVEDLGAPMDVLWFRLPRHARATPDETQGRFDTGRIFVDAQPRRLLAVRLRHPEGRRRKGARARARCVPQTRSSASLPFDAERACADPDWDDVKLLTVLVDRLNAMDRPGLLCIGDAAHAMSPVGGVGINLAIQDAVAAANLLAAASTRALSRRRSRRPCRRAAISRPASPSACRSRCRIASSRRRLRDRAGKPTLPLAIVQRHVPLLAHIPARLIGLGVPPRARVGFIRERGADMQAQAHRSGLELLSPRSWPSLRPRARPSRRGRTAPACGLLGEPRLDVAKRRTNFWFAAAQRGLGIELQMARDVGHRRTAGRRIPPRSCARVSGLASGAAPRGSAGSATSSNSAISSLSLSKTGASDGQSNPTLAALSCNLTARVSAGSATGTSSRRLDALPPLQRSG